MLRFLKVTHPLDIQEAIKQYDPLLHTWLVSDLKSKQEIQSESVARHGYFTDDAIMRISDFWRLWMRRLDPTVQVVSGDFIRVLVQSFVEQHGSKLDLLESEVSTLATAVQEFAPLLIHPSSRELMAEWLEEDFKRQQKSKKWQRWYQLADACLNSIIQSHHVIDSKWSAAYLQSVNLDSFKWSRPLFVDLGSELSAVEMGLFKILSQHQDVTIITPDPSWAERFPFLLKVYGVNEGFGQISRVKSPVKPAPLKAQQFKRISTQLGEVKMAVSQCRLWADQGVPLNEMAILAADIEKYWPVLQTYLDEEGLPYKKETVAQLNSLGDIQNLTARLKSLSQDVSWDSLEKTFFSKEADTEFRFEKFKALFYQLYDEDDLGRELKIKNLFYKQIDLNAEIERDQFLGLLVKTWMTLPASNMKDELFEVVFKDILAQSLDIPLKMPQWLQFFSSRLSRKELILKRGAEDGLHVLPLMSAHMLSLQHKVYIGLNDEFFNRKNNMLMSSADAQKINDDLGLSLDVSEENALDFNLRWQAGGQTDGAVESTLFTSAHLSFSADPLNASLFFIENSPQSETSSPARTRLDEMQLQYSSIENIQKSVTSTSAARLEYDMTGVQIKTSPERFKKLSASELENYAQCSFKLLAAKGFRLRDEAQIAIDLDPRDRGNLVHALFEHLIGSMNEKTYSTETVTAFLDQERVTRGLYTQQEPIWLVQRNKFLNLAQKFVEFESERAKVFSTQTEKEVALYFDLNQKKFTLEPTSNGFAFNLRLDRIDRHRQKKYAVIYDYKSSGYAVKKSDKWLDEKQFQMLLYITALKLTAPEGLAVKGSLYYFYKSFDIKTGLIDQAIGLEDFLFHKKNSSLYAEDDFAQIEKDFIEVVTTVLEKLNEGVFEAKPFKNTICDDCDWRQLCRAVHLM